MFTHLKTGIPVLLTATLLCTVSACDKKPNVDVPPSPTIGTHVDDSIITARAKMALLKDDNVKGFDIAVTTTEGIVSLSGTVDNQHQIDTSVNLIRGIEGVKGVNNHLVIKVATSPD